MNKLKSDGYEYFCFCYECRNKLTYLGRYLRKNRYNYICESCGKVLKIEIGKIIIEKGTGGLIGVLYTDGTSWHTKRYDENKFEDFIQKQKKI